MPKIHLPQKNLVLEVKSGAPLMEALLMAGVPVASSCLGDGICGKCRVHVIGMLMATLTLEIETLKRNSAEADERLSCQIKVQNDIQVTTSYW